MGMLLRCNLALKHKKGTEKLNAGVRRLSAHVVSVERFLKFA